MAFYIAEVGILESFCRSCSFAHLYIGVPRGAKVVGAIDCLKIEFTHQFGARHIRGNNNSFDKALLSRLNTLLYRNGHLCFLLEIEACCEPVCVAEKTLVCICSDML